MSSAPPGYGRPRSILSRGTNRNRHRFLPLPLNRGEFEELMDIVAGEIVDTPDGVTPYRAIFRFEDQVVFEWPVNSVSEGEARIAEALTFLHSKIVELRDVPLPAIH
jgi:hypothetical protein